MVQNRSSESASRGIEVVELKSLVKEEGAKELAASTNKRAYLGVHLFLFFPYSVNVLIVLLPRSKAALLRCSDV